MSLSPNASLVQRTIDLNYANRRRSSSLKWIVVNIAIVLLFVFDLCRKCPGYTQALHYVELCAVGVLSANVLQHARRIARGGAAGGAAPAPARPRPEPEPAASLSPRREWRADASPPPSPPSPASPRPDRAAPDQFIADPHSLAAYLRGYSQRQRAEPAAARAGPARAGPAGAGAHYQLSAEPGAAPDAAPAAHEPPEWRRLQLDPQRLEQWTLNLRLWLHVTILQRLVRELGAADEALAASGLDARLGAASAERLRAAAAAHAQLQSLPALLAYLEPFADQRYVVQRIRELAQGGCLSGYRWNGGGSEWDEGKPTDAELLLHLLATYLDAQLPGGPRAFSAAHLSGAPAPPPRGPGALGLHRLAARPPHWALALGGALVEPARGRNNLLHALLLFLAAAARADPPALRRLHLGRAGLNMLWVIGR